MWSALKVPFFNRQRVNSSDLQSEHYWLILIILLAVLLRMMVATYLGNHVVEMPGTFDQVSYDMLAQQVLKGHGFTVSSLWWPATRAGEPTAHWSYLYTLYLVAVYGLFGYYPLIARLIQAVLAGVLMPWLAYRLGRRHFNPAIGLVTAGLMAFYIYFIYYAGALMTETFYIMAILWTLDLAGQLAVTPDETQPVTSNPGPSTGKFRWLLLGLALSGAVLLRQVFLLFIPFLFGWLLWRSYRHQAKSLRRMAGILAGATLILIAAIVPWTYRNYQAFNTFVLLNTNAGFAFFWGNHPIHGYNFISILPADGPAYQDLIPPELRILNEAELDRALLKRGLGFIQEDPVRYLILSLSRFKDYFKFWPSAESSLISNLSRVLSFGILWPFMIYGFIYSLRPSDPRGILILHLFILIYIGIHVLSWSLIRYRLPVDAVLLVFAGVALKEVWTKLARRYAKTHKAYAPTPFHLGE